ncbi:phosphoenolpyruvate carboxylase [Rarobacter faecitabidus]|uniref:phosphoenolpyruvate carboxylase n=1 Tax=Rarobacter faecitabidus TaxID=13243 RepID=UPI00337C24E2
MTIAESNDTPAAESNVRRSYARHEVPEPLREDVRLLGRLLGTVLEESGGPDLLADVERLRELTIAAYDDPNSSALDEARELVDTFTLERAQQVARAFTCYFHLANLAEEYHRIRVLRQRETAAGPRSTTQDDTLPEAFTQLAAEVGYEEAVKRLTELEFRPVLTAHPTEARRRAVTGGIRRVSDLLAARDSLRLGGTSLAENERSLLAEIDGLWRTALIRSSKPSVQDEVRQIMAVFESTLFNVIPAVYRRFDDWLLGDRAGRIEPLVRPFVGLGSWIGGDRDGNPNVTAEVTREAAQIASERILIALERSAHDIARRLTADDDTTPPSAALNSLWDRQRQLSRRLTDLAEAKSINERHRAATLVISERIAATRRRDADLAYASAEQLESDLRTVQDSLIAAGAPRAAYGALQNLIWQVQTFGFHLVELEVRQHSQVHEEALADIAEHGLQGKLQPRTVEVLDTFRAIGAIQRRYGVRAVRRFIVSFTQKPEHLEAVYQLANLAFADSDDAPIIDAIPLFETFADLENSVEILEQMLMIEQVKRRLEANGRRVEVMLGYSDSSKDVGPVSATLALHSAQERIAAWAERHNITLTLFHGRGGALGRGGGPANRAVLAQPPHSVDGRFKLTEQGEVILARYGDPTIAVQHIEHVAAATLLASAPSVEERNAEGTAKFAELAGKLDETSRSAFHRLVKSDGFPQWFAQVTPLEEVGLLPIGSRPARRGLSVSSLDDLRAIPWVFSWSQARLNLAGWYGLGSALEAVGDVDELRAAYREWPVFATMIDNVEMSLAKSDDRIAEQYLALGDRDDLSKLVLDEYRRTVDWVLKVTDSEWPLANRRVLGRAVQLRSPYVGALSLIQVRALTALRTGNHTASTEELQHLLLLSVNGVAAGLQNTG